MNGRPSKTTVDFFPHYTASGKTIFTLESLYGNDGYAFWFKILELLGSTENHIFNYSKTPDWVYLLAKTKVDEEKAKLILKTLADLEAIDPELYHVQILWSDNFVHGLLPVYSKRSTEIPSKPSLRGEKGLFVTKTPQSRVEKSKVEKKQPSSGYSEKFELFWEKYPKKKGKSRAFTSWKKNNCENGIFETIMKSLEAHKKGKDWVKDGGQFIPHGSTWVCGRGWEDEPEISNEKENEWI